MTATTTLELLARGTKGHLFKLINREAQMETELCVNSEEEKAIWMGAIKFLKRKTKYSETVQMLPTGLADTPGDEYNQI